MTMQESPKDQTPDVSPVDTDTKETIASVEQDASAAEKPTTDEDPQATKEDPMAEALAAANERYLRLMADFDNMRKRTARELEERTARANERLLKELIPVFDDFEMALLNAPEGAFSEGVKLIATRFQKVLEQSGAEMIDATEGTAFDPMMHEAMTAVPHPQYAQGIVVNQFRKGWRLGGKIVRPAQVIVSSGAPQEA